MDSTEAAQPSSDNSGERARARQEALAWDRLRAAFDIESICGPTDDTEDVELYKGGLGPTKDFVFAQQPATGQIQWKASFEDVLKPGDDPGNVAGVRWCSGTLISDALFLTAGHCFDKDSNGWETPRRRLGSTEVSLMPGELAPLMQVNFNYQRDASKCTDAANPRTCEIRKSDVYPIVRLVEHRRGPDQLDYAIVELGSGADGQLAGLRYRPETYDASSSTLALASILTIIQHPNGVPKRVGAGGQVRISGNSIYYSQIDTLGGSSGAGVIDQAGRVIGVHTNGGCFSSGGENSGVALRAIAKVSDIIR